MDYSKTIIGVLSGVTRSEYSKQESEELYLVIEDIFNQLELKCKVSHKEDYFIKFQEVFELHSLVRNLISEMYLSKLMSNHHKEQVIKSLNQIITRYVSFFFYCFLFHIIITYIRIYSRHSYCQICWS